MTSLKCLNSGVESNGSAFILSPLGCGVSFRVPAVSEEEAVSSILRNLAGQFLVGNPASDNLFHDNRKPLRVRHLPVVIAKRLLVDIPSQVERLDTDVCSVQTALQKTPKVLHRIRVNISVHVLYGVINYLMLEFVKTLVGFQSISKDRGTGLNVVANMFLQFAFLAAVYDERSNVSAALHDAHHGSLVFTARPGDLLVTLCEVHVASLATDEGFVNFDLAIELRQ